MDAIEREWHAIAEGDGKGGRAAAVNLTHDLESTLAIERRMDEQPTKDFQVRNRDAQAAAGEGDSAANTSHLVQGLIQGVMQGIGFLGAGAIMRSPMPTSPARRSRL